MTLQAELRDALERGDAGAVRSIYHRLYPAMPQPTDHSEDMVVLHQARTAAESVSLAKRLYSHAWLTERGLQSGLPNALRPPAEQRQGRVVAAVGVSYGSKSRRPDRVEEAAEIERVMARAAGDLIREGITDRARIAPAMWAARERFIKGRLRKVI